MAHFARRHYEAIGDVIAARVAFMREALGRDDTSPAERLQHNARLFELALVARDFSEAFARDNDGYKPERFAKRCGLTEAFERDIR